MTCNPWNPVAMKNLDPNDASEIENGASIYSKAWNVEKINPRVIVIANAKFDFLNSFFNISWCAQVTVTPDDNNKMVLSNGILIGLNGWIERGGHLCPSSTVGEILLWKNAQKNETKKKTSDAINKIIPVFSPFITTFEWFPCVEDSRWTSRHHLYATIATSRNEITADFFVTVLTINNPDSTRARAPLEAKRGHGLISTKWKGLYFFIIFYFCDV